MRCELIEEKEMQELIGGSIPQLSAVLAIGAIALITITVFKLYQSSKGKSSFGNGFDFEWEIEN